MKSQCWLCGSQDLALVKPARMPAVADSAAFRITDAHYGYCGAVYLCKSCGFRECPELDNVLGFYEKMDDRGTKKLARRALCKRRISCATLCPTARLAACWISAQAAAFRSRKLFDFAMTPRASNHPNGSPAARWRVNFRYTTAFCHWMRGKHLSML